MLRIYRYPYRNIPAERLVRNTGTADYDVHIPMDVYMNDDAYIVEALVPGISANDIEIEIVDQTLSIRGEFPHPSEDVKYIRKERAYGKFERVLRLPKSVDSQNINAHLENGILTLRIPKAEEAKPKHIKVKVK